MMLVVMAPAPEWYDLAYLEAKARGVFPGTVSVGEYGPIGDYRLVLYTDDSAPVVQRETWASFVDSNAVPAPVPSEPSLREVYESTIAELSTDTEVTVPMIDEAMKAALDVLDARAEPKVT